ncbi:hypothetical protein HD554DRAFT_2023918, partial [Boletus coccyginus]
NLLFQLTTWHVYVKLCLYTTNILNFFDMTTKSLSQVGCKFLNATYIILELS